MAGLAAYGLYAWKNSGKKVNPIDGAEMAWIPAGSFQMGGSPFDVHTVPLSGYRIYTTPVTVAQFRKYDDANGNQYHWKGKAPTWGWIDDHPMVRVTWDQASAYAKWAGGARYPNVMAFGIGSPELGVLIKGRGR